MIASDFTRDDCRLGNKRISYAKLQREYRCNECGGCLVMKWTERCESFPDGWHVECAQCEGMGFVHEYKLQREQSDAIEVLAGLPPELAAQLR